MRTYLIDLSVKLCHNIRSCVYSAHFIAKNALQCFFSEVFLFPTFDYKIPFFALFIENFPHITTSMKVSLFLVCYWKGPRSCNSCGKSLSCWLVEKAILNSNLFINKSHYNISQSTFTCSKWTIETLKKWMKFTQIWQQKHQNDGIDTPFASVYIVEFEQVNVSLIVSCFY